VPNGVGPFPTLIFHHGSTGRGDAPALFTGTFESPSLARLFNESGWLVAFPQRRGRGASDGLYDEGFEPDRRKGFKAFRGSGEFVSYSLGAGVNGHALLLHPDLWRKRVLQFVAKLSAANHGESGDTGTTSCCSGAAAQPRPSPPGLP